MLNIFPPVPFLTTLLSPGPPLLPTSLFLWTISLLLSCYHITHICMLFYVTI